MTDTSPQQAQSASGDARPTAWKGLVFLGVLILIGALLTIFVLQNRSVEGPLVASEAPKPISVTVAELTLQDGYTVQEKYTGLITSRRTSQLGFSSGGRIAALSADVGDRVRNRQMLAKLDSRALRAQLLAVKATVAEAEASHALALSTVSRQQALLEKGHVSYQALDQAVAQADAAKARIEAAQANVSALQVQIDLSAINAPFSGTITQRMADEGAIAAPGAPIFELVETGRLEAEIGLSASIANSLEIGETYTLTTDQGSADAKLRSVTGVIDQRQRTVKCLFDIIDPSRVSVGAVVRIDMPLDLVERGAWLPVAALTERQRGLWSVYIARPDEDDDGWFAQPGQVEIIHATGDLVYVRGALRSGDQVILDGLHRITPGQPVTPTEVVQALATGRNG